MAWTRPFCIDGQWLDAECNGIFTVDASGRVSDVRDYVDLGEWRARAAPALDTMRSRRGVEVVRRHLAAVELGDPVSMAADYSADAVLHRGITSHDGWDAIADYFDTVPQRLAGRSVEFQDPVATAADEVVVQWQITGDGTGDGTSAAGRDTFVVQAGRIVRQTVELDTDDF
jgi:ketosteroid isomerase-like protein